MEKNIPLNWDSNLLYGYPRNQRLIANYWGEGRLDIGISVQDFSLPGYTKPHGIPERMIYMSCVLNPRKGRYKERAVYVFRTVGEDTPENRDLAEAAYQRLIFITNKVTNKRCKESEKLLRRLAGA
jgi:hypothetical protein